MAGAGLGERAFRFEAARTAPIVERLLEFPLDGAYQLGEGAAIRLRGTADRIDLLADGTLRLLDYKTGKASSAREPCRFPSTRCAPSSGWPGIADASWDVSEAGYLAFGRAEPFVAGRLAATIARRRWRRRPRRSSRRRARSKAARSR